MAGSSRLSVVSPVSNAAKSSAVRSRRLSFGKLRDDSVCVGRDAPTTAAEAEALQINGCQTLVISSPPPVPSLQRVH